MSQRLLCVDRKATALRQTMEFTIVYSFSIPTVNSAINSLSRPLLLPAGLWHF